MERAPPHRMGFLLVLLLLGVDGAAAPRVTVFENGADTGVEVLLRGPLAASLSSSVLAEELAGLLGWGADRIVPERLPAVRDGLGRVLDGDVRLGVGAELYLIEGGALELAIKSAAPQSHLSSAFQSDLPPVRRRVSVD